MHPLLIDAVLLIGGAGAGFINAVAGGGTKPRAKNCAKASISGVAGTPAASSALISEAKSHPSRVSATNSGLTPSRSR